ncbi:MAG: hypothetical protein ACPG47_01250 [Leucothrix sp.]
MNRNTKLFIVLLLCVGIVLSVIYNETLWNIVLLGTLLAKKLLFQGIIILKKFFFKKGIASWSTIAWKRVLASSAFALSKRAIINTASGFFQERIVKPLIHPLTRYLKIRWLMFKESSLWKKITTVVFGSVPATIILWLVGVIDALLLLLKSFSLAKFLTLILKFITTFFVFFQGLWKTWIQPYIDLIIVTILFSFIEKIPVIGPLLRRVRITIKWKWRHFKYRKEHVIKRHVDANVNAFGEKIHKHVNAKKEIMAAKVQDTSQAKQPSTTDSASNNQPIDVEDAGKKHND